LEGSGLAAFALLFVFDDFFEEGEAEDFFGSFGVEFFYAVGEPAFGVSGRETDDGL
jgi:hypothetical protein